MLFSVVIPAHNAEPYLAAQLSALASQVDADPFEVIVVDNLSTDSTRDIAGAYTTKLDLRIVAAMEGQFETERCAPLRIGGLPDVEARETRYAIEIPCGLSFLSATDPNAEILGLERWPRDEWPSIVATHFGFQVMVGAGTAMMCVAAVYVWVRWRGRRSGAPLPRIVLSALVVSLPLGFLALEAGWLVTEAGRQPWVIYRVMRTADAVTPVESVTGSLVVFSVLYATLLFILVFFLRRVARGEKGTHA